MTTPTASNTALVIPELLGMILLHLGPNDIARCQRTSSFWRDVIGESPSLKASQYLRPVKNFESLLWRAGESDSPTASIYHPHISPEIRPISEMNTTPKEYPIVEFHPILINSKEREANLTPYKTSTKLTFSIKLFVMIHKGPWLDMLISQPPVQEIELSGEKIRAVEGRTQGGVIFRDLLKRLSFGGRGAHITITNVVDEHSPWVQEARQSARIEKNRSRL
ncbi:uncharacterized protein RCC_01656 [Ramularia collo-cygni]|uniref:F-box domain-containing protein n=1 Tax=Ramularia collo-cygni TaxID=112498 RepID=A0A2D3UMX0_9PEZI|nr:uncharacterized protein RCC_01656 [Ramularia collo-cygni]CZT15821.1 uncharacterized protein RCC_01656 [Ramularia collo-cygni]